MNGERTDVGLPHLTEILRRAEEALRSGRPGVAVALLEPLVGETPVVGEAPAMANAWRLLGFAYGAEQRIPDAGRALAQAAVLEPQDPVIAVAHAQATLDSGLPAVALFERALRLAPGNLPAVIGLAAALAAEEQPAAADTLLAQTLRQHPQWLAGHKSLADLRWTLGDSTTFDRGYREACAAEPQNLPLRLAWFTAVAQTHDWPAAMKIIVDGETLMGSRPSFAAARAFIAGESGDTVLAERLFAQSTAIRDDTLRLAHLRHCLRTAQLAQAESLALALVSGNLAPLIWPYLSTIWRLRGDARARWLDGEPPYIRAIDLNLSAEELQALATVLRRLHTARGPYLEQSVRGGTQTDTNRQLFFRAEPEIQRVRTRISAAVREYLDGLPPQLPGHPLLGMPRDRIQFSGSWSVRLRSQGFNVSHNHPMGWISSALYVSLPPLAQRGPAPAGWIRFGCPPPGLGLSLPAYAEVEPKPGLLVLFPSTMWHETIPFDDGERLVIAFDVMRPRPSSHQ